MVSRIRTAAAVFGAVALLAACSPPSEKPSTATSASAPPSPSAPSSTSAGAAPAGAPEPSEVTPVVASVIAAPIPVPATDNKVHLVYELQMMNVLPHDLTLTSVTVLDRDVSLLHLTADELGHWTRIVGNPTPTTKVGPGQTAVGWLDVALDKGAPVPTELTHAIAVSNPEPNPPLFPATTTSTVARVTVQTRNPIVISPPLVGPRWMDANGCCDMEAHRMALNPIDGALWVAERFAIDYLQLDPQGRLFTADKTRLESYPGFGAEVHAVKDGTVISVVDGLPEQVPGKSPTGLKLDEYAGNHVVQDLGDGNYALYAHLETGSVKVKPGDRLTTGQVLGLVGNSGNSDAPHLHFHVMSSPDPLRSDGFPFVFSSFKLDSRVSSDAEVLVSGQPAALEPGVTPRNETDVIPMSRDVMTYAAR